MRLVPLPDDGTLRSVANLLELLAVARYNDRITAAYRDHLSNPPGVQTHPRTADQTTPHHTQQARR